MTPTHQREISLLFALIGANQHLDKYRISPNAIHLFELVWTRGMTMAKVARSMNVSREWIRLSYNTALDEAYEFVKHTFETLQQTEAIKEENVQLRNILSMYENPDILQTIPLERLKEMTFINQFKRIPLTFFDLSTRASNVCKENNLTTVADVMQYTPKEFNGLRNCGQKVIREMKYHLKSVGAKFRKAHIKNKISL